MFRVYNISEPDRWISRLFHFFLCIFDDILRRNKKFLTPRRMILLLIILGYCLILRFFCRFVLFRRRFGTIFLFSFIYKCACGPYKIAISCGARSTNCTLHAKGPYCGMYKRHAQCNTTTVGAVGSLCCWQEKIPSNVDRTKGVVDSTVRASCRVRCTH